ncbi:MAG: glycerate kinase [Syntrophales bacterium]|nr:glycerate kinase [Syntrophales bacterium]
MKHNPRKDIRKIFDAGLKAADPKEAVSRAVCLLADDRLQVGEQYYDLGQFDRIIVVGAGKAAAPMAAAIEDILGPRISDGFISTKYGHGLPLKRFVVTEAGHPVPDEAGLAASRHIINLLEQSDERDLIICLISGGGSALMPLPVSGISLTDKQKTTQILLACGATIHEINTIRKHISGIKGGKLARAAFPGTLITLILSDVIGDNLDVIASGPTVPDRSTFADCTKILEKYNITDEIPPHVIEYLKRGARGIEPETPKLKDTIFDKTDVLIIGSLSLSIDAARDKAVASGYNTLILSSFIEGETRDVAKVHAAIIKEILKSGNPVPRPACIISGGETTVTIHGNGLGGRNMEFVLAAAIEIEGLDGTVVLSGGTDGTDGPTDAAGAIADGTTVQRGMAKGYNASEFLKKNDSYNFFKVLEDLLMTGPTMTNVMDLRVLLVV